MTASLPHLLAEGAYHDYVYSYPHKTAYRALTPEVDLREAWRREPSTELSLYLHVPFCEMRCGFCNLFTAVEQDRDVLERYAGALARQAAVARDFVDGRRIAHVAIGGGTPTLLPADLLERVLDTARTTLGADLPAIPVSVETSPETATAERIALLRAAGVDRVSIGVQSFDPALTTALKRRQDPAVLRAALERVASAGFTTFNVDLIYGIPGQTPTSLCRSIDAAIGHGANELYLYPLYVRQLTGLAAGGHAATDRGPSYHAACDHLAARGWVQHSMRRFGPAGRAPAPTTHVCQEDGMLGLGPGARSYTDRLHYSSEYAVRARDIRAIIADYCAQPDEAFARARHGLVLGDDERRRRYLILSLLDGAVAERGYTARFGTSLWDDFPCLAQLMELGLATAEIEGQLTLTPRGVGASDAIGHWLFSPAVRGLMQEYVPR